MVCRRVTDYADCGSSRRHFHPGRASARSGQIAQSSPRPDGSSSPWKRPMTPDRHYRPDENSANTSVSYYVKGAVMISDGREDRRPRNRTLDDLLRARTSTTGPVGSRRRITRDLAEVAPRLPGRVFAGSSRFWRPPRAGIPEALEWFDAQSTGDRRPRPRSAWRRESQRANHVVRVRRGTPSFDAGFDAEDEPLAIDDVRIPAGQLMRVSAVPARRQGDRPGVPAGGAAPHRRDPGSGCRPGVPGDSIRRILRAERTPSKLARELTRSRRSYVSAVPRSSGF